MGILDSEALTYHQARELAEESDQGHILELLSRLDFGEKSILSTIAKNPHTEVATLMSIAAESNLVAMNVVRNPNIGPTEIALLYDKSRNGLVETIAVCEKTPPDILNRIALDHPAMLPQLAGNPNSSESLLGDILRNSGERDQGPYLHFMLAGNPSCSEDMISRLYFDEEWELWKDGMIVGRIAANPSTHPDILDELGDDASPLIRFIVSRNPNTGEETLRSLLEDEEKEVAQEASKTLAGNRGENPWLAENVLE